MKKNLLLLVLLSSIAVVGCKKSADKAAETTASEQAPASAPAPEAKPAELTDAQKELAEKQKLMDYATMEDTYINDPKAQWASGATASSTFGDSNGNTPADSNLPKNITGKLDGKSWTNSHQDIGFDWIELTYDKPVNATEVRLVLPNGVGSEAINKVELQDTDGKWNTAWSGISDVKPDDRGARTWFVRTFSKTTYKVKAVKITIANNLDTNYKVVDAAQLVGE